METIVIGFSSQRMYRDLFWVLADIAPVLLVVLLVVAAVPRTRRVGALGVLVGAAGAAGIAVVFHTTYAITTWGGHASAIRWLDESAACAGFAAGALAYGAGVSVWAAGRRLMRGA